MYHLFFIIYQEIFIFVDQKIIEIILLSGRACPEKNLDDFDLILMYNPHRASLIDKELVNFSLIKDIENSPLESRKDDICNSVNEKSPYENKINSQKFDQTFEDTNCSLCILVGFFLGAENFIDIICNRRIYFFSLNYHLIYFGWAIVSFILLIKKKNK